MTINKGSDLVLRIKDEKGNGVRVSNKSSFFIRVFTTDKNNYLEYGKEDVVEKDDYDTLHIPSYKLAKLDSGVIAYTYGFGVSNSNFDDGEYNRIKTVYTNFYFSNDGAGEGGTVSNIEIQDIRESISKINEKINAHTVTVKDNTLIINT